MSVLKSVILTLLINRLTFRMKKQYTSIQSVYTLYIYIYRVHDKLTICLWDWREIEVWISTLNIIVNKSGNDIFWILFLQFTHNELYVPTNIYSLIEWNSKVKDNNNFKYLMSSEC
jgi:hypothetical protein